MADQQPMNQEERSNLVIMFFHGEGDQTGCPRCHARLNFEFMDRDEGWLLVAQCRRCGLREALSASDDPIVGDGNVLSWAGWEPIIVERYFQGEPNHCPACNALIISQSHPGERGETVHFRCPRCRQTYHHRPGD